MHLHFLHKRHSHRLSSVICVLDASALQHLKDSKLRATRTREGGSKAVSRGRVTRAGTVRDKRYK